MGKQDRFMDDFKRDVVAQVVDQGYPVREVARPAVRRDCFFVIEDQEFWFRVKRKHFHVDVLDGLNVQ